MTARDAAVLRPTELEDANRRYVLGTQASLWWFLVAVAWVVLVHVPVSVILKVLVLATTAMTVGAAEVLAEVDPRRYAMLANGLLIVLAGVSLLGVVQFVEHEPLLWLGACLFAGALPLIWRAPGLTRAVALSGVSGIVVVCGAELVLSAQSSGDQTVVTIQDSVTGRTLEGTGRFWVVDPQLGFGGRPNSRARVVRRWRGRVLVQAEYGLDSRGKRLTGTEVRPDPGRPRTILVLGDSFAFGEGVSDPDTMPAQLERLATDLRSVNLAFKGYGPHQAVASLEARLEEPYVAQSAPIGAVYYAVCDPMRPAGLAAWDTSGPRYVLTDGQVRYAGSFQSNRRTKVIGLLNRSSTFSRLVAPRLVGPKEVELSSRLIGRVAEIARERWGLALQVVLWGDRSSPWLAPSLDSLKRDGIRVFTPYDILPDYATAPGKWVIERDGHPLPETQKRVAEFLLEKNVEWR